MSKKHTVAVFPTGQVEYTRHPAMSRLFGDTGDMVRVSDIQKVPGEPLFMVKWLRGPCEGQFSDLMHHRAYLNDVALSTLQGWVYKHHDEGILYFDSYENAVEYEVLMLAAFRKRGISFGEPTEA